MTNINCRILNIGRNFEFSSSALGPEILRYRELVQAGGGAFHSGFGECVLRVIPSCGHAVIGLKFEGEGAALAVLAKNGFGAEILWDELCQTHVRMMRAAGQQVRIELENSCPASAPWLAVLISPSFLNALGSFRIHQATSVLTAAAFVLLE